MVTILTKQIRVFWGFYRLFCPSEFSQKGPGTIFAYPLPCWLRYDVAAISVISSSLDIPSICEVMDVSVLLFILRMRLPSRSAALLILSSSRFTPGKFSASYVCHISKTLFQKITDPEPDAYLRSTLEPERIHQRMEEGWASLASLELCYATSEHFEIKHHSLKFCVNFHEIKRKICEKFDENLRKN